MERIAQARPRVESAHRVEHAQQSKRVQTRQNPMQSNERALEEFAQFVHQLAKATRGQAHGPTREERGESGAHTENSGAQVCQALS